jgi:DNA-binding LacI/PurR family transcriptional regulator
MRVSIRDIARRAGVSHVTVANVLNGRLNQASPETSELVLKIAREMDYIPVPQPSTQRRHVETRVIGVVFDSLQWEHYWGLQTYQGLRDGAIGNDYDLLTILRKTDTAAYNQQELRFLDRRSDGIIFLVPRDRDEIMKALVRHKIPVVSCYNDDVPAGVGTVKFDNRGAIQLVVQHLIEQGHRQILYLGPDTPRSDFNQRLEGYITAATAARLKARHMTINLDALPTKLFKEIKRGKITAIACAHDAYALRVQSLLLEAGYRVPEDISLTGVDDVPRAAEAGLTTIRLSGVAVGRLAVETVVALIRGATGESVHHVVPVELVKRESVAPPAKAKSLTKVKPPANIK